MRRILFPLLATCLWLSACLLNAPDTKSNPAAATHSIIIKLDTASTPVGLPAGDTSTLYLRPGDSLRLYAEFVGDMANIDSLTWMYRSGAYGDDILPVQPGTWSSGSWVAYTWWGFSSTDHISLRVVDKAGHVELVAFSRTVKFVLANLPSTLLVTAPKAAAPTDATVHFQWDSTQVFELQGELTLEVGNDSLLQHVVLTKTLPKAWPTLPGSLDLQPTLAQGLHYWRLCASDHIDRVCSAVESFYFQGLNLENGGELRGKVSLDGLGVGTSGGVVVSIQREGESSKSYHAVDSAGSFSFTSLAPGRYTVSAVDTLQRKFKAPADTVLTIANLVPTTLTGLAFTDTAAPHAFLEGISEGDTLYALADNRTLHITGGFTDNGSGIDEASVSFLLDGSVVTGSATFDAHSWSLALPSVADGPHVLAVIAQDRSGRSLSVHWPFSVNAKRLVLKWLSGPTLARGDTLRLAVQVTNLSPTLQQLRWSRDGNGWEAFTANAVDTIAFTSGTPWSGALRVNALDGAGMARDTVVAFQFQ